MSKETSSGFNKRGDKYISKNINSTNMDSDKETIPQEDFKTYSSQARNEFVETITYYFPHESPHDFEGSVDCKKIRVAAEDILIAYDQLREYANNLSPLLEEKDKRIKELIVVDEILLKAAKENNLYVDFSEISYDGEKEAPMDRIGLIDYFLKRVKELEGQIYSIKENNKI